MKTLKEYISIMPKGHSMIKMISSNNHELLVTRHKTTGEVVFTYDNHKEVTLPAKTKDREAINKANQFLKKFSGSGKNTDKYTPGGYFK